MGFFKLVGAIFSGLILLLMIIPLSMMAQEDFANSPQEITELYKLSETYYSINDEYINGFIYPVPNFRIPGDPYLNNTEWNEGTLFINGKTYSHLFIKYDLIIDEVIIKVKTEQNIERLLAVNKSQIDSFIIHSSLFLNSDNLNPDNTKNAYYEKVFGGQPAVYKQYEKRFIDSYSNSSPLGKFSSQKSNTYLFDDNDLTNINNKKSFLECFEKTEQEKIKKFLKVNKINYNKISKAQLVELMKYCATIISR
ncbi:MAG TPA: hypothetical protein VLQ91_17455 [Draconibacterium sp.]|nr:hypothetical protein [Draconibacterium sp.]